MNVAALLQDSPSDDSHRRRPPPAQGNAGNGPPEHGERGGASWTGYERTGSRVQSQNQPTWPSPSPYQARPPESGPSTPISTDPSSYAHPKDSSWSQPVGNPYPPGTQPPPPTAPYDSASQGPPTRLRADSGASTHLPVTTGPGVPPSVPSGSSYMPPPDFPPPPPHHLHKSQPPPPPAGASSSHYPTPLPVAGQPRLQMSHSPPISGSPFAPGPPPSSSSTPRRPQSQLATPQTPHAHGPPSAHPSPAMASLQNPGMASGPWGPGGSGPGLVDAREREHRDRTHPGLTSERERDRAAERERDMNIPLRDRDRDWDSPREQSRTRKQQPSGPGVPPPTLAGPGTGAPPPLGPGIPPIIPDDPHKISTASAPGSGVPSRAHSRSQLAKDDLMEHAKDLDRSTREIPPTGPGRTPDYPPPRDYPPYRREPGEIPASVPPPPRRERDDFVGPGGPTTTSRLPPPEYRPPADYPREPHPPQEFRREHDYRQPDYGREPYRREHEYRRAPLTSAEFRRDGPPPGDFRRDPPPPDYRDYRRDPPPPHVDYRRDPPPPADHRREPSLPDYRGADYRDPRRDVPPSHSPEAYRRELPDYRREREPPQDYPPSRRNSNEHRRERDRERMMMIERDREMRDREREADLRRGDPGSGPGIPPGERQPRRSPHQTRDLDRDPYLRRNEDPRREPPPPNQPPHDHRGPHPPPPPEGYRSEYRQPSGDYRREPPPPDYPPRRDHHPHPQDYRREEHPPRQPSHSHVPPGPPPPPIHPGQDIRGPPPPGPPGEYRGSPADYRRDGPPGPPPPGPPQEYRRDVPPPDYRGPPGSIPPPGDYLRQGPPPPQDFRSREPGEIVPGPGGRDYTPRRERDREHLRDSGDYPRPPPGDYPRGRREEGGEYIGRSQQPNVMPPGPGVPGRATPTSEPYVVKHPAEQHRDRERERWERERERDRERERGHYPPSQPPSGSSGGGPPPPQSGNAPPSHHHTHSHPHLKHPPPPHHHAHHHHHVIHQHHPHPHGMHQGPPPSGPPSGPPGSGPGSQGPPPTQGGPPPPPSQRQLQNQFPTRFVSVTTHPGSRMGSPAPGGPPGPGAVGPGGSSSGSRKDVSGGKDMKKMPRGGPPGPPSTPGSRRDREEREKERGGDIHQPYPQPLQPGPHREQGGRVLGHGYPHGGTHVPPPHGGPGPHGQPPYPDEYMVVDDIEQQQREHQHQQQQIQLQQQSQHNHHHHHHHHPQSYPHLHQIQHPPPPPSLLPHAYPLAPQVGYYPGTQEGVEDFWPQEQPDREVKSKFKINLGTFVYPNTPFPYHFDVGEWIGVNGVNGVNASNNAKEAKGKDVDVNERTREKESESEKTKEGEGMKEKVVDAEKKMEVDGEEENVEKVKEEKEKEKEKEQGVDLLVEEKEKGKMKEQDVDKNKEKEKEREKTKEVLTVEKTTSCKEEVDDILDVETRATILIPNGYIPREKPLKPAIWGGGVIGRPLSPQRRALPSSSNQDKSDPIIRPRKRRIYTDDSDLFLCALHSGWLTWSASARARDRGQDLRVEVRIIRCAGAGAGSVYAVGAGAFAGKYAPAVNGAVTTNGTLHRKTANGKVPVARKEEIVGRFIGGWGEKCFVRGVGADTEDETENDEENDGRGLVSAGWGSGHDGSAIEVLNVEFVSKGTARSAPGVGRRNRSQRLLEYNERRAAVLGLQRPVVQRLAGRKRRRAGGSWMSVRRLPNASVLDVIPEFQEDEMTEDEQINPPPLGPEKTEESQLMAVRTVVFGIGVAGDMRLGYKYQPDILKDILFPLPLPLTLDRPPRKRRRTTIGSEDIIMDVDPAEEPPAPTPNRPVMLETPKETYMLSLTHGSEFSPEGRKYDISLILEGEVEEEREDAVVLLVADKNAVKVAQEVPPPTPPSDEPSEPTATSPDATIGSGAKSIGDRTQKTENVTTSSSSRPSSPSSMAPRTSADVEPTTDGIATAKVAAVILSEDISMVNAPTTKQKSQSPIKSPNKTAFKHPVAQVLQRRVGEDMFKFLEEGISIADGEDGMPTEWLVQVKSWKWATRKVVRV